VLVDFIPRDQYDKIITIRRPPYNKNFVPVAARFAPGNKRSFIASKVLDRLGNERTTTKIICACPYDNCPHRNQTSKKGKAPGSKGKDKTQSKATAEEVEDIGRVTLDWTECQPNEVERMVQKQAKKEQQAKRVAGLKKVLSLEKGMDIKGKEVVGDDANEIELQPMMSTTAGTKIELGHTATVTVGKPQPDKETGIWHRGVFHIFEGGEVEPGIEMVLNREHATKIPGLLGFKAESTTQIKQELVDPKTGEVIEVINDFTVDSNMDPANLPFAELARGG